ncbi:MAG TPA: carbon starvation protein A, partial [Terriglobales bacterium]|nr:carbon starvation protein A [Terriglobales bacterium]
VTLIPMVWLVLVTFTAGIEKIFHSNPRIGFLAHARQLATQTGVTNQAQLIFNDRVDAAVTGVLLVLVGLMIMQALLEWVRVLSGRKVAVVRETPFVPSQFAAEEA